MRQPRNTWVLVSLFATPDSAIIYVQQVQTHFNNLLHNTIRYNCIVVHKLFEGNPAWYYCVHFDEIYAYAYIYYSHCLSPHWCKYLWHCACVSVKKNVVRLTN